MKAQFTPGSWIVMDDKTTIAKEVAGYYEVIAEIPDRYGITEQDKMDAQLISASPEMFQALLNVERYLGRSGESSLLESFGVNQAIAKARGES